MFREIGKWNLWIDIADFRRGIQFIELDLSFSNIGFSLTILNCFIGFWKEKEKRQCPACKSLANPLALFCGECGYRLNQNLIVESKLT